MSAPRTSDNALECDWGTAAAWTFTVTNNGSAFSVTGKTLKFMVKAKLTDADADAIVTYTTTPNLAISGSGSNIITITLAAAAFASLSAYDTHNLVFGLKDVTEEAILAQGTLKVLPAVVRAT